MALGSFNATIVNSSGDIVPGAEIEVRRTSDNALANLFSDASRTAITNPFNAHAVTAFAQFFAERDTYTVAASTGAGTVTWTVDVTPSSDGATYAPTRAEAILLNVPAAQDILFVRSSAGLLAYVDGTVGVALTTSGGRTWVPSGDATPEHWADNTIHGTTDMTSGLIAALAASDEVFIRNGTLLTSTVSVGAGKVLTVEPGGFLTAATAISVAFNNKAKLNCGIRQPIFQGSIAPTNLPVVWPEWFGVISSSVSIADVRTADWQRAAAALRDNGVLELAAGFYPWDGTAAMVLSKGQLVVGVGDYHTTIRCLTAGANGFSWTVVDGGGISKLRFQCIDETPTSGLFLDFSDPTATRVNVSNIWVAGCYDLLKVKGLLANSFNIGQFRNIQGRDVYGRALEFDSIENVDAVRIFIDAGTPGAPNGGLRITNRTQGNNFDDVHVSNVKAASACTITNDLGSISRESDVRWNKMVNCSFDDSGTGVDLNNTEMWIFVNLWANSNGRTANGANAGNGLWIRDNCSSLRFIGGSVSNNGERGVRYAGGAKDVHFSGMQFGGNNVNGGSFYNFDVYAGATDWSIKDCDFGGVNTWGWTAGSPSGGVQIRDGASDRYDVTGCRFVALSTDINDSGTGTDKDVTTGNRSRA
jgi:hypothetical protein